jgi:rhamnosyltransferase subunit B
VLTGFPLFDERGLTEPPADVLDFLDRDDPPVVFTAGSAMRQGHAFFAEAAKTCQLLGRRGLLVTRYPEQLSNLLPEGVRHCEYIPFSQLLPRAAALVHHGGIGTTAQALAAGIPQLIMPMSHDQPDNAARVERLGVGRSLRPKAFRAAAVGARLDSLLNSREVAARCQSVADKFKTSDPIGETCCAIEEMIGPRLDSKVLSDPASPA